MAARRIELLLLHQSIVSGARVVHAREQWAVGSGHKGRHCTTRPSAAPHATTDVRQDVTMQPTMSCRNYYPWPRRDLTHTRPEGAPSLPQRWTAEGRKPSLVPACSSGSALRDPPTPGWPDWTAGLGRRLGLDPCPAMPCDAMLLCHGPLPGSLSHWVTSNALVASCGNASCPKNLIADGC